MLNAAIIGYGNAGQRFSHAIDMVNARQHTIEVKCVADSNFLALSEINLGKISIYESYQEMLFENELDLIFIATNDNTHFSLFKFIKDFNINYRKIVCEKPLVNTASEMEFLYDNFHANSIFVHFVERYSDACQELINYISENKRKVKRVFLTGQNSG
ncbi:MULTISPECIES: Gfo/Idh/MocA family oxidoreductase [Symbiopectobacterium]|uniref:Gfo/Idh/MocA family oxidoreductase n=1 Tax=Symbiopectobacterium TaxID=801 RepID=UPI001A1A0374|nr:MULTISPECIES: Gfo/Idh/MocA family oxidoreductase [Symbiopectobacterium]MBG6248402.1 hypothetical protein [Candidatus Symbiopectobacterium sp. PLON1]MBT9429860.1 Gfo/Idh/MocA family oxidoreductase [Candidatus Symbiopectobacterium endolongispinus]